MLSDVVAMLSGYRARAPMLLSGLASHVLNSVCCTLDCERYFGRNGVTQPHVMVVDPATDAVGYFAVGPRSLCGMIYASATGKLYGIPAGSDAVVILDPVTNTTDVSTMTGFGGSLSWNDAVYVPVTNKICKFLESPCRQKMA